MIEFLQRCVETLRQLDCNPRCYELTEQEQLNKIKEWNNRNIWNTPELAKQDRESTYYGA